MSSRSYQDAIEHLNSLQTNAAVLEAVRASGQGGRLSKFAIPEMLEYLERIGYSPEQLNDLNVIHITGTKGKGSTSAFVDSILRTSRPDWKVGLYTSPHLVAVRERIRINGAPISEDDFTKYFFQVWDKLVENNTHKVPTTPPMPGYFRFLTLMAFHVFSELKVDATILEVGVGGTFDSTNIVPKPAVTGITSLGLDHTAVLGKTIEEIAWQKSGIYKQWVPAFTVPQPESAMEMIRSRAEELKASELRISSPSPELSKLALGLSGSHQISNAALAVDLAKTVLNIPTPGLPDMFVKALQNARWPGRCQVIPDENRSNLTWYLDGAHTVESLECCMKWFATPGLGIAPASKVKDVDSGKKRVLVFNCTSGRSGDTFLKIMMDVVDAQLKLYGRDISPFFDHVIFCTNVTYADGHFKGDLATKAISESDLAELKVQQSLTKSWLSLFPDFPSSNVHTLPSIEHAIKQIDQVREGGEPVQVLVTGSLHLVGGVIEVAQLHKHLDLP